MAIKAIPARSGRREFLFLAAGTLVPAVAQFSTGVRVVNVFVTVRDRQGKLVSGLAREDFEVSEDGRRQTVRYFAAHNDLPVTLALLFDISGSQRSVLSEQREAAAAFLKQVLRPDQDRAILVGFNRGVRTASALAELEVPRSPGGQLLPEAQGTALFDAVAEAARRLQSEPGRKALVVLSDGIDTASSADLKFAVESAQRSDCLVYPIRVYDREVFAFEVPSPASDNLREGKRALERLARETGGTLFEVTSAATLAANFARLEEELRNQYSLGYTPSAAGAKYRKVRVSVRPRGLSVQARDGYYPPQ